MREDTAALTRRLLVLPDLDALTAQQQGRGAARSRQSEGAFGVRPAPADAGQKLHDVLLRGPEEASAFRMQAPHGAPAALQVAGGLQLPPVRGAAVADADAAEAVDGDGNDDGARGDSQGSRDGERPSTTAFTRRIFASERALLSRSERAERRGDAAMATAAGGTLSPLRAPVALPELADGEELDGRRGKELRGVTTPGGAFLELAHRGEATAASLARAAEFRSPLAARLYSGADDGEMARLLRRIERAKVADKGELGAPDASGVRHAARAAGLLHLNLSHSLFSLRQIKALAACLSRDRFIGSLALRNNRVDNKGLGALLDALAESNSRLAALDVSDNVLTHEACATLRTRLSERATVLHRVDLGGNALGYRGVAALLAPPTAAAAGVGPGSEGEPPYGNLGDLQELGLSNCGLNDRGVGLLAAALGSWLRLSTLELGWNSFTARGAALLARGLSDCSLTRVDLSNNGFGDSAGAALAAVIVDMPCLVSLDLSADALGSRSAAALAEALVEAPALTHLALLANPLGAAGVAAVAAASVARRRKGTYPPLQELNLRRCTFARVRGAEALAAFNEAHPGGEYVLNLADEADREIAARLAALRQQHGPASWQTVTLAGGRVYSAEALEELVVGGKWSEGKVAEEGILTLRFEPSAAAGDGGEGEGAPGALSDEDWSVLWAANHDEGTSDEWRLGMARVLVAIERLRCAHAAVLLRSLAWRDVRVSAAAALLPRLADADVAALAFFDALSATEQQTCYSALRLSGALCTSNATGLATLDLGAGAGRAAAAALWAVARQCVAGGLPSRLHSPFVSYYVDGEDCVADATAALHEGDEHAPPPAALLPCDGELEIDIVDLRQPSGDTPLLRQTGIDALCERLVALGEPPSLQDLLTAIGTRPKGGEFRRRSAASVESTGDGMASPASRKKNFGRRHEPQVPPERVAGVTVALRSLAPCIRCTPSDLLRILRALPEGQPRVAVGLAFFARVVPPAEAAAITLSDAAAITLSDVMRALRADDQVELCSRLGWLNVLDMQSPSMRYKLDVTCPQDYLALRTLLRPIWRARPHIVGPDPVSNVAVDDEEVESAPSGEGEGEGEGTDNGKMLLKRVDAGGISTVRFDLLVTPEHSRVASIVLVQSLARRLLAIKVVAMRRWAVQTIQTNFVHFMARRVVADIRKRAAAFVLAESGVSTAVNEPVAEPAAEDAGEASASDSDDGDDSGKSSNSRAGDRGAGKDGGDGEDEAAQPSNGNDRADTERQALLKLAPRPTVMLSKRSYRIAVWLYDSEAQFLRAGGAGQVYSSFCSDLVAHERKMAREERRSEMEEEMKLVENEKGASRWRYSVHLSAEKLKELEYLALNPDVEEEVKRQKQKRQGAVIAGKAAAEFAHMLKDQKEDRHLA